MSALPVTTMKCVHRGKKTHTEKQRQRQRDRKGGREGGDGGREGMEREREGREILNRVREILRLVVRKRTLDMYSSNCLRNIRRTFSEICHR